MGETSAEVGAFDVRGDAVAPCMCPEFVGEPVDVETKLPGVVDEVLSCELPLVVDEKVAHRPEGLLRGRGFGGFGRELGVRVYVAERQMAPHVSEVAEVGE